VVCLLSAAAVSPVFAQNSTLESRIEVRFEATPAADVFRHIISGLGYELQLDALIDDPVTLWVTNVTARTALNVLCESLGCSWRVSGNRLVVGGSSGAVARSGGRAGRVAVRRTADPQKSLEVTRHDLRERLARPLPVDMQFQDVPVSTILRAMSEVAELEITADEPLASRHVTLSGRGRTVNDALRAVVEQAGGGAVTMVGIKNAGADFRVVIKTAVKPKTSKVVGKR
jgi:hypothetical protein